MSDTWSDFEKNLAFHLTERLKHVAACHLTPADQIDVFSDSKITGTERNFSDAAFHLGFKDRLFSFVIFFILFAKKKSEGTRAAVNGDRRRCLLEVDFVELDAFADLFADPVEITLT